MQEAEGMGLGSRERKVLVKRELAIYTNKFGGGK